MKYKINKGFISQKMGKKLVIFDGERSVLYTLNETGSFIFKKLKLGWAKQKIIDGLANKYRIQGDAAKKDVEDFILELESKKIVILKKG